MNVVLLEPEIPQNTANIARTCAVSNSNLHLIRPLGFEIDDKRIRRAGMDYWYKIQISYYDSFDEFIEKNKPSYLYFATTKAKHTYCDVCYDDNSYIVFGKESKGIPEEILVKYPENCVRIPMAEDFRSINLASSAAIILYESLRQNNFKGLLGSGELHNLSW